MRYNHAVYLAGFLDGEGTITIVKGKTGGYTPFISITNTDKRIMDWLKCSTGKGNVLHRKASKLGQKAYYTWRVYSREALEIAKEILPELVIKRKQAQLLIKYYAGFVENCNGQLHNPDKKNILRLFRKLNKRGE